MLVRPLSPPNRRARPARHRRNTPLRRRRFRVRNSTCRLKSTYGPDTRRNRPRNTPLPPLPMPSIPTRRPHPHISLTRGYRVSGKVQGVYFRHSTRVEAKRLGLRGSVRNLSDGSVAVLVQGAPDAVETLRLWLHRGPAHARVERVSEVALGEPADLKIP